MNSTVIGGSNRGFNKHAMGTPLLLVALLSMLVLPLPPFALDILFTFNIALALVILLASIYTMRPLDFAVFPTVLLISTLLRLTLNVASTRVVLLNGHTGTDAAGQVVQSFGEVVIGGNYAVGFVVFAILVIINFVVVTKGAGRVSEVSARFTLDAMPGKQMAVDADLNAGVITQEEAKIRRAEVSQEADFYGAMDGASKFVRGDAVAGILILFVNLVGGLAIGMGQHSMSFSQAIHNYALLTIGDGLVAQIPSLLLSTGAAIMVTRVSSSQDMGAQVINQLLSNPRVLTISGGIIAIMGLIPGMPHLSFLGLGGGTIALAYYIGQRQQVKERVQLRQIEKQKVAEKQASLTDDKDLGWDDVQEVDLIGLEVGYRLIPIVDSKQDGQLLSRIKGVRKKVSQELGFLVPTVHIRDNLDLAPAVYRIMLMGVPAGEAEIQVDKMLAINPGQVYGELEGIPCKDPAFGLDAIWIMPSMRDHAQAQGYTVVDPSTVVATHLSQILQDHAAELLGHEDVQQLLDRLSESTPKLVEELVPTRLSLGGLVKILQRLLEEQVNIRDIRTICESLAEATPMSQDPDFLLSQVRVSLGRAIIQNINGLEKEVPVMTLSPELEQLLLQTVQVAGQDGAGMEPGLVEHLQTSLADVTAQQEVAGDPAVLLVASELRNVLARFARSIAPGLHVIAYPEMPENRQIRIIATIGGQ